MSRKIDIPDDVKRPPLVRDLFDSHRRLADHRHRGYQKMGTLIAATMTVATIVFGAGLPLLHHGIAAGVETYLGMTLGISAISGPATIRALAQMRANIRPPDRNAPVPLGSYLTSGPFWLRSLISAPFLLVASPLMLLGILSIRGQLDLGYIVLGSLLMIVNVALLAQAELAVNLVRCGTGRMSHGT